MFSQGFLQGLRKGKFVGIQTSCEDLGSWGNEEVIEKRRRRAEDREYEDKTLGILACVGLDVKMWRAAA